MPVLFISHASADDRHADALVSWLDSNGFADIFSDHESIAGGDKWREALRASANACRVVIFLVTADWLASEKCSGEFEASWLMGKRLIPLFLLPSRDALNDEAQRRLKTVKGEDQGLDIAACIASDGTLDLGRDSKVTERLRTGLRAAGANTDVGLDPEAFVIDRKLRDTPFPGLASFGDDDADAALFYGRSDDIAKLLELLRKMRACPVDQPIFILGASGAGKSSLLKAGVIPRLRRETPAWLPLRVFRPGADPLRSFADALARTYAEYNGREAPGDIHDRLFAIWLKPEHRSPEGLTDQGLAALSMALEAEGGKLRKAADRPGSTILISVDQAEEIARADGQSGEALADYLRAAQASKGSRWQLVFTIRTDSFPEFQSHRCFQYLKGEPYDLRAIPTFRFENLVEKPARRYGVPVDAALITALMEHAPKGDALPLLAFALQRLWRQYGASGQLTKANYTSFGALKGLIEDAAERALRGMAPGEDRPLKSSAPSKQRDELGAATFVPALVQLNDEGAIIRRVASMREFSEESQELLGRFDDWRLVVRKGGEQNGRTVEVAHEALFREWTRLQGWLEPERARLEALRSLQLDAAAWDRAGRNSEPPHRGTRLLAAEDLLARGRYTERLTPLDRDYLAAARAVEEAAIAAEAARAEREAVGMRTRRRMLIAVLTLLVGTITGLVGWLNESLIVEQWHWHTTVKPYIKANIARHVLDATAERALKPGETFRECLEKCPEMVVLPGGVFTMGSPDGKTPVIGLDGKPKSGPVPPPEEGRSDDEGPQHEVTIARFAVGEFEVTFDDWGECVALGGCPAVSDSGGGAGRRPVINVSWDEAKRYVAWFSHLTGKEYRLLTEAEWEYAARAGASTVYSFGDDPREICKHANLADVLLKKRAPIFQTVDFCDDGEAVTAPVGSYAANPFGLYDMHGNVWEWTEDCFPASYEDAPREGTDRTSEQCRLRVLRGGSWYDVPQFLRAACRGRNTPDVRNGHSGFRVSRTLNP